MRAKFEHACMISDRVENVSAFVEKYVFEYRTLGLRLHTWQQLLRQSMWACALLGAMGAGMYYRTYGMGESVYHYGGIGAALMVLLFLLQVTTDEKYLLKSAKIYMIDYLENVCMHRYEKAYQREAQKRTQAAGQAVFAGAGAGDRRNTGTEHFEKKEKTEAEPVKKVLETAPEKVVPMETDTEELLSRKKRKELRREMQEGQKKKRFGRKAAEDEELEPMSERLAKRQDSVAAVMESEPDDDMESVSAGSVSGGADAVPREAIIREILEEFMAQRT